MDCYCHVAPGPEPGLNLQIHKQIPKTARRRHKHGGQPGNKRLSSCRPLREASRSSHWVSSCVGSSWQGRAEAVSDLNGRPTALWPLCDSPVSSSLFHTRPRSDIHNGRPRRRSCEPVRLLDRVPVAQCGPQCRVGKQQATSCVWGNTLFTPRQRNTYVGIIPYTHWSTPRLPTLVFRLFPRLSRAAILQSRRAEGRNFCQSRYKEPFQEPGAIPSRDLGLQGQMEVVAGTCAQLLVRLKESFISLT